MIIDYKKPYYVAVVFLWLVSVCAAQQTPVDSSTVTAVIDTVAIDTVSVPHAMPADSTVSYTETDSSETDLKITGTPATTVVLKKPKSPKGAMIRSLIIPGWGQFYNGKWFKGIVIGGTEIGLVVDAVIQNQYAVRATDKLEKEFYQENRSLAIWWLGAAILYSITDAFVDAHLYDFDDSPELSLNVINKTEHFEHTAYSVIMMNFALPL